MKSFKNFENKIEIVSNEDCLYKINEILNTDQKIFSLAD